MKNTSGNETKIMIASDIHGSERYCSKLIERLDAENADRLLLLGDILYHGPRNALPDEYAPKSVITMLNRIKDRILCVRGNCDTEVDAMMLEFPIMADYCIMYFGNRMIFCTHGHMFGEGNPPPLKKGDILLCGHTHVPKLAEHENYIYMNPGSVSIPKNGSERGYMLISENKIVWKNLEGFEYMKFEKK